MLDIDISKITSAVGEPTARFVTSDKDKRHRRQVSVLSGVFFGVFVLGTLITWGLSVRANGIKTRLASEVKELQKDNAQLLEIEQEGIAIDQRNKSALEILKNTAFWSPVFDELAKADIKSVVFSRFEVESMNQIRINGSSPDYQSLAKLIVSLNNSEFFNNVSLASSSLSISRNTANVEFAVTLALVKDISRYTFAVDKVVEKSSSADDVVKDSTEQSAEVTEEATTQDEVSNQETPVEKSPAGGVPVL